MPELETGRRAASWPGERALELRPDPSTLAIAAREVRRLAHCGPSERWRVPVDEAIALARTVIAPRGSRVALAPEAVAPLFAAPSPVEAVVRAGTVWGFIATIGGQLEALVRELLDAGSYLEAVLLDAAGSCAVEALADALEASCPATAGEETERFSPGYCHWSLEAQPSLLALFGTPEPAGVRLRSSRLMEPLKSCSGVIVRAARSRLRVPASECARCDARGCTRRQARALE
jgi:hypothetical protein